MKILIDIPEEEYKTLSKMSEKEKVNELSYYERIIANGTPYEEKLQGKWICPNCDLYEQVENDYCQYAGKCTISCWECKYFEQKGGAE